MKKTIIILQILILFLISGGYIQMVRGHKDYGEGGETKIIHSVSDMGELAARLGSPDVFQRSGNVIFITGFENGMSDMVQDPQGTGSAIDLMGDRAYSGGISVRLTGGSDGGRRARLTKRFHTVETNQMGIEVTFSMDAKCDYVATQATVRDGENKWVYAIYANMADGEFQYYDTSGVKIPIAVFDWGNDDLDHWHTIKMIIDMENQKYVRAYYNEKVFELTDIDPYQSDTADAPRLDFTAWTLSEDGENGIAYVDNFIITINEP